MQKWKTKRRTMRHYDQLAQIYNTRYAEEQKAKIRAALNNAKPRQSELILDMGCGTGLLFEHVADSARLLVGIDVSSKILREAKRRAEQLPNMTIIRADVDYTPFQSHIFDCVFAITLLQNMPNPLKTLQEIKRIGDPNSRIIVTGLRKKFTQESFTNLLDKAELKVATLAMDSQLKEYVAVCRDGEKNT